MEIQVAPEQAIDFTYTKVGKWQGGKIVLEEGFSQSGVNLNELKANNDTKQAIEKLEALDKVPTGEISAKCGNANIRGLEEGVYLMQGKETEGYEVQSALITIPAWDEATGEMNFEIKWIPKIQTVVKAAATGDVNPVIILLVVCAISLLFIARTLYFSLRLC